MVMTDRIWGWLHFFTVKISSRLVRRVFHLVRLTDRRLAQAPLQTKV